MFRSIRSRLVASYLFVILLSMGIASSLAWRALDRVFLVVLRENLLSQASRVAHTIGAGQTYWATAGEFTETTPPPYSQSSNIQAGIHTRIIDEDGVIIIGKSGEGTSLSIVGNPPAAQLSESSELALSLDLEPQGSSTNEAEIDLLGRSEIQSALSGVPATAVRTYSWAPDRRVLYAAHPVTSEEGSIIAIAYIATPLPRFNLSILPAYFGTQVLAGLGLAILLAGLAGVALAHQLTRPIRQLTSAASALAQGRPVPPLPQARTRELDILRQTFNTMNRNLTQTQAALMAQTQQREIILDGITDAVLAVDQQGEVVMANPKARELADTEPDLLTMAARQALNEKGPQKCEVTVQGNVIELHTTSLHNENGRLTGAVTVGHDVTAFRQLDRLRTNFVSDVSHELRTPLTALKGTIETLLDGAMNDSNVSQQVLETVARETDRLIDLTNDLLLLSRADAGRLEMELSRIDLTHAIARAISQLQMRAREQHIWIQSETEDCEILVMAHSGRLHQILINLLDNALKFTPPGGSILITASTTEDAVACTVSDTGPGIPPQEIPQLFERFYRGDRSRARVPDGGAGLGLSIVKALVDAHGGRVWVESPPGDGARVTFTLHRPTPPNPS